MTNNRTSNLDLLRILATLMVICNHLVSWTNILPDEFYAMTPIWLTKEVFFVFLRPAVNCFVLISGYFLCTSSFKLKKPINIWVQTLFYGIGIYLLVCLFHDEVSFSFSSLLDYCFPAVTGPYWFITDYLLMYALSPFLNILIKAMDKNTHRVFCLVLLGIFSVISNLLYSFDFTSINGGYSFVWFCILYIIAAYIRMYVPLRVKYQKWMLPLSALFCLGICGEKFLAHMITPQIFGSVTLDGLFYAYNSILSVPCALCLFQGYRGLTLRSPLCNRMIHFFAPLTFSAYLIHGHTTFNQILLRALDIKAYSESWVLFPYLIFCTLCIFIVACGIEKLRQWVFSVSGISKGIDYVCDSVQRKMVALLYPNKSPSLSGDAE